MKTTVALALALFIGSVAAGQAAFHGGGHAGTMSGIPVTASHIPAASHASMGARGPVTLAKKIRTPRQCFRFCRGTLGASVDFCAVSCYR